MASIPRELSPADSALGQPPAGKLLSEEQFVAWCDEDTRAEWSAIPPRDGKVASIVVPGFYLRAEGLLEPTPASRARAIERIVVRKPANRDEGRGQLNRTPSQLTS